MINASTTLKPIAKPNAPDISGPLPKHNAADARSSMRARTTPPPATLRPLRPLRPPTPAAEHPPNKYAKHAPICSTTAQPSTVCPAPQLQSPPAAANANRRAAAKPRLRTAQRTMGASKRTATRSTTARTASRAARGRAARRLSTTTPLPPA